MNFPSPFGFFLQFAAALAFGGVLGALIQLETAFAAGFLLVGVVLAGLGSAIEA
jgi:hypothetical protein